MENATIVTSGNREAFINEKLGVKEEPKVEPKVEKPDEEKKTNKLEKRFSELTTKNKDLARRVEEAERKAQDLEAKLNPKKANEKPKLDAFKNPEEYAEAIAEWSVKKALKEREQKDTEEKTEKERNKLIAAWEKRSKATIEKIEDYEDVIASSDAKVSDQVRDAIVESDVGPEILYYLAKNPEFVEKLSGLTVTSALREIGKLEAKLEKAESKEEVKKKAKEETEGEAASTEIKSIISNAPPPISPLKGGSSLSDNLINSKGEFVGTPAQWRALRTSGKIK